MYVAFDTSKIKSADTVTYDDGGNVIPLSERFNNAREDIRYQSRDSCFKKALTGAEWKKYNNAMTSGVDAGLRISKNSLLVECENGDYSYKPVIYDNEVEDKPIKAVYAIGVNNQPTTGSSFDEKVIAEYIIGLE